MTDVAMPFISSDKETAVDACDIVDAMDAVGLVDAHKTEHGDNENEDDADFSAFKGGAQTLEGETVADAQMAAAAEIAHGNIPVVEDPTSVFASATAAATEINGVLSDEMPSVESGERFVTPKDFELFKVIGMGAFGKVLQVKNRQSGQILAMKVISKRLLKRKQGYIENIQAERNILTRVKHPFVVTMHCSFQTREKLFIIMDFLAGGELFLRLGREGIFLEKDAAFYLAEITLGLDHLHNLGILHRDLKPENILLGHDGHICLTDFGLAKDFGPDWDAEDEDGERANTICGTQEYMSPEMLSRQRGYGKATDYWSLGCIAYEMLNGLPPFSSKQGSKELFKKIMSEKVKMPTGSTAAACKLLKGLLNRNPDARLGCAKSTMFEVGGIAGLKQCAFFAKIDWAKLERKELEPPYDSSVENDSDLRHFHNDFTSMPLPRSVREMSDLDALPRRVESEFFRGFSFIQADFSLPSRDANDVANYWKSQAEGDGESDSDVASSKMGGDEADQVVDKVEAGGKKKRPPRKRKKKGKNSSAASSSLAATSPAPSEQGDAEAEENTVSAVITTNLKPPSSENTVAAPAQFTNYKATHVPAQIPASSPSATLAVPRSAAVKSVPPKAVPQALSKPKDAWQSVPVKSATRAREPQQDLTVKSNLQWKTTDRPIKQTLSHAGNSLNTPQQGQGLASPNIAKPHSVTPKPGSWAARAQSNPRTPGSAASVSSTRAEPSRSPWSTPSAPSPAPNTRHNFGSIYSADNGLPSPSSNWREHSSPHVKRVLNRSMASPSLNQADETSSMKGPKWPSLNDFPAVPTIQGSKTSKGGQPAPKMTLKGAWAKRAKS